MCCCQAYEVDEYSCFRLQMNGADVREGICGSYFFFFFNKDTHASAKMTRRVIYALGFGPEGHKCLKDLVITYWQD